MRDLSELLTLPYLGAFDVHDDPSRPVKDPRFSKRVTYIALTKKVMPMLRDTFLRFRDTGIVYTDGTLETIFSVSTARGLGLMFTHRDLGIRSSYKAEIRMSCSIKVRQRSPTMEDSYDSLFTDCQRIDREIEVSRSW